MLAALAVGLVFGAVMQAGSTYQCDCALVRTPWRQSALPRALLSAIGLGMILIYSGAWLGLVHFHVKAFYPMGIALGALIFGAGVGILGYCPGTLPIAIAERRGDGFAGLIGGVLAGTGFTAFASIWAHSPWHGPTFSVERLGPALGLTGASEVLFAYLIGGALLIAACTLGRRRP